MNTKSKDIQLQYQGFLETPFLFDVDQIKTMHVFTCKSDKPHQLNLTMNTNQRLGKLVERFVSHELKQKKDIKILAENVQIQQGKLTLGELDCLLLQIGNPIHLEVIYKFYLYDKSVGTTEIDHWVGPNRRDSLIQKLEKLQHKQLPLLYHKQTRPVLEKLQLTAENIKQQIYFKAQLFVTIADFATRFEVVNHQCIVGFYIYRKELGQFANCKFHIPHKHDWLVEPHVSVNWLKYDEFRIKINEFLSEQSAPLCWLKRPNGQLFKFFVVWW